MAGGTLTLDHVTVSGNSAGRRLCVATGGLRRRNRLPAARGDGSGRLGGGIYVAGGVVYVNQSIVSGNQAVGGHRRRCR